MPTLNTVIIFCLCNSFSSYSINSFSVSSYHRSYNKIETCKTFESSIKYDPHTDADVSLGIRILDETDDK